MCLFVHSCEYPEKFNVTKKGGHFHYGCEINGKKIRKNELFPLDWNRKKPIEKAGDHSPVTGFF
ncbi:hypothetical protein AM506_11190 [Rossellomorea vietnamensis]|uniref:Uncharacterized protein n=1 Tax=Rossellomorea vietnamensis TaxID=218284 RepID=A0A0P6W1A6_9BACI|nr:hypothetical protein AM506_11190 [Rossellomorea vietnamensis]